MSIKEHPAFRATDDSYSISYDAGSGSISGNHGTDVQHFSKLSFYNTYDLRKIRDLVSWMLAKLEQGI